MVALRISLLEDYTLVMELLEGVGRKELKMAKIETSISRSGSAFSTDIFVRQCVGLDVAESDGCSRLSTSGLGASLRARISAKKQRGTAHVSLLATDYEG